MQQAYISAGTNMGDRIGNLEFALKALAHGNSIAKVSSYFETEPVGYRDQPWFLNIAVAVETSHSPVELLNLCHAIEQDCGRVRSFPNAPRTLDLDILLFGDLIICEEQLVVPHPRLQDRRFVLEPLAQIAPEVLHPVLKKSILSLLKDCPDPSQIRQLE